MIKIEHPELDKIANDYFDLIKGIIMERAETFEMILEQILNQKDNLDKLAKKNWGTIKSFTKLLIEKNQLYSEKELKGKDITKKDELENKLKQGNKKDWVNDAVLQLCQYLSNEDKVKRIILASASDKDVNCFLIDVNNSFNLTKDNPTKDKERHLLINKIIDYDILKNTVPNEKTDKLISYWLTERLNVNTCPYCNRSPIHTVFDNSANQKGLIRPTLDHFYPKAKYPFLALSFYNLIPSCYFCNSSLKGGEKDEDKDKDNEGKKNKVIITPKTHLNPYIDGFGDDAKFSFEFTEVQSQKSHPDNYKIILDSNKQKQVDKEKQRQIFGDNPNEGNVNLFKLERIYQVHRDLVGELVVKAEVFKAQQENIRQFYQALSTNDSELYQFYFGNYLDEKDHNKRPLAKLTKDIVTEIIPNHF